MIINKAFKYRIYPKEEQITLLKQCGGNTRFLWNYFWTLQQEHYQDNNTYLSYFDFTYFLPILKKSEGFEFLSKSYSQSLQQVGKDLRKSIDMAYSPAIKKQRNKAIAKAMSEKDEDKKAKLLAKAYKYGFPKYHKKHNFKDSFRISSGFKIKKSRMYIPNVGWINYIRDRKHEGKAKYITISQNGEHWYVSVCCEVEIQEQEIKTDNIIGIDLGLKTFAAFSDGTVIDNPKIYRNSEKKLKREQRILSRKQKGSNRRKKQQLKVQRVHRNIKNKRKDFLQKLTSSMITKYDGFVVENLAVSNMVKNHKLAKSISDVSWSEFCRILEYKSYWHFKYFEKIDRYAPSSQLCSSCGSKQDMPLDVRIYKCDICGHIMDRDINASINILGLSTLGQSGIYAQGDTSIKASVNCEKDITQYA